MTTIGGIGLAQTNRTGSSARRGAGGFSLPDGTRAENASASEAVSSVAINGPGGQQERSPDRDERARRRARDLLEGLDGLQRALLLGRDDPALLDRVARLCEGEPAEDPGLEDILQEIVLRARIELVRRNR